MKKMTILYLLFLLASCSENNRTVTGNKLHKKSENVVKDNLKSTKNDSTALYTGWYYLSETENRFKRQMDKSAKTYFINPKPILTVKNFKYMQISEGIIQGQKQAELTIEFNSQGADIWSEATKKSIGKQLAFIVNNQLLYVPEITAQINSGGALLNRNVYSGAELKKFKAIIENEMKHDQSLSR